ncbi:uncharacterized protein LOC100907248 [Galendromus occidentalis]|uniref:Uncharacterized protein LOC100907248 n=1 Tax=Galendromus occidentalis TaxID=34638 RepID=A0AAJ6QXK5_9ACAR|nr:uncharacterized protein LOC100907248 [Galendromus occidentalis]
MADNFLQGMTEPGGFLSTITSNENLAIAEQLGLYLTLNHFEGAEKFYRQIVGLRLANQALELFQSGPLDTTEQYRNEALMAIAQYVKSNPRCREDELQAEICRQIQIFAQKIQ